VSACGAGTAGAQAHKAISAAAKTDIDFMMAELYLLKGLIL
jgi:hypothetical protein